jgi:formylglycine-generating enzyme required for sulfatase activity
MAVIGDAAEDVFISYKSERRRAAEHVGAVVSCQGYTVWHDYHLLTGADFGMQIEQKVRAAKVVMVLWCSLSVKSRWVIAEASLAERLGSLVPIMIEPCELPIDFRRKEYINLIGWDGSPRSHLLDRLWDNIERCTGHGTDVWKKVRAYEQTWRRFGAPSLQSFGLGEPLDEREQPDELAEAVVDPRIFNVRSRTSLGSRDLTENQKLQSLAAAQEWPLVRDSGVIESLARFEEKFAATYHATMARELREIIVRQMSTAPSAHARDDHRHWQIEDYRTEGRIRISARMVHGAPEADEAGWFLPTAGQREWFKDHEFGPDMVVIPAGEFSLGTEGNNREGPRRSIVVARPFAVSRFVITFEQWDMAEKFGGIGKVPDDMGWGRVKHPVIHVSWDDATAYCAWLSRVTGQSYGLLTEAEWEYICRAGTTTPYWQGKQITRQDANFDVGEVPRVELEHQQSRRTVPVDSFPPNPWGLYQVHGNVWEWVADNWHPNYLSAPAGVSAWTGGDASLRVVRGGSWSSGAAALRSANRECFPVDHRDYNIGFRVLRTL